MGVPWPSRSHLGSDLAQTFHAGQFSWCHVSCRAAHGAQVRLVMPAHRALGITVPSAIIMQPCQRAATQQQVSQLWPLREACEWCWPRGRWQCPARTKDTCARYGVESADAWCPNIWKAGPDSYYLCPSSHSPKATGSKPQGQEQGSHRLIHGF